MNSFGGIPCPKKFQLRYILFHFYFISFGEEGKKAYNVITVFIRLTALGAY